MCTAVYDASVLWVAMLFLHTALHRIVVAWHHGCIIVGGCTTALLLRDIVDGQ